ncbi:hypothetical protein F5X99DRAFT_414717 [Biscogniauxia marginata]|nr:hypothetical protein F5X99DRAFT_414717 [Biscogniauxia marginata]
MLEPTPSQGAPTSSSSDLTSPPWQSDNLLPAIFIVVVILATAIIALIVALLVRKFGDRAAADKTIALEEGGRKGGQTLPADVPPQVPPRDFAYENSHSGPTPMTSPAPAHLPSADKPANSSSASRRQAFDKTMTGAWGLKKMPAARAEGGGKEAHHVKGPPNRDDGLEDVDLG